MKSFKFLWNLLLMKYFHQTGEGDFIYFYKYDVVINSFAVLIKK